MAGEFALFCLGYNIERARNLLGFQKNDGIDGTGINLFLHTVYFIQFSMEQNERKGLNLCLKIKFSDSMGREIVKYKIIWLYPWIF